MLTGIGIGSIAITIAMIVYDIRDKKQKKDQKKQKPNQIKLALTGGPYIFNNLDAEAKVKGSICSIIH